MLPILYSFRRCPYAIRARIAVLKSGVSVELREVVLRNKPESMLRASPKGTVPVLVLPDGGPVLDESLDVMRWALAQRDPEGWLANADTPRRSSHGWPSTTGRSSRPSTSTSILSGSRRELRSSPATRVWPP